LDLTFDNIIPENITANYISSSPLWNNQFCFKEKEYYLIRSISGKGKSTLINILSGKNVNYNGTQHHNKSNCENFNAEKWIQVRKNEIALVNQDLKLIDHLTVMENLILKLELTAFVNNNIINDYLIKLGIEELKDKKCCFLSMGQLQRVAIIRGLLQPFKWILLDEPFSHLDQENKNIALELIINSAKKQNAGIVLTTLAIKEELNLFKAIDL
jgi:ABC-type lipoprotein export system ATPase subunit